jgi:hypothetical protein
MGKIIIIIGILYFLYYAGNMLYDLFLKKEKAVQKEESEVYSIVDFNEEQQEKVTIVGIEDVENLNTPNSFIKKEIAAASESSEERQDLEKLRKLFESEQDFELHFDEIKPEAEKEIPNSKSQRQDAKSRKPKDNKWQKILNLSETMVQLISNKDGYKVYYSTM